MTRQNFIENSFVNFINPSKKIFLKITFSRNSKEFIKNNFKWINLTYLFAKKVLIYIR